MQTETAISAISSMYRFAPIIIWGVAIVILLCYQLDKKYPAMMEELKEREARGEL